MKNTGLDNDVDVVVDGDDVAVVSVILVVQIFNVDVVEKVTDHRVWCKLKNKNIN